MASGLGSKAIGLLDHFVVSLIIALQFLGCLGMMAALLLFSRYPGADYSVAPAFLIFGAGIAAAVVLNKNQRTEFWRRVPACLWNVFLAAYLSLGRGTSSYVATFSVCAAIYLGATAMIGPRSALSEEE